jgi:hypothetical protein
MNRCGIVLMAWEWLNVWNVKAAYHHTTHTWLHSSHQHLKKMKHHQIFDQPHDFR